jgi:UPF0716 family protein affecting phage T7 exclusion
MAFILSAVLLSAPGFFSCRFSLFLFPKSQRRITSKLIYYFIVVFLANINQILNFSHEINSLVSALALAFQPLPRRL